MKGVAAELVEAKKALEDAQVRLETLERKLEGLSLEPKPESSIKRPTEAAVYRQLNRLSRSQEFLEMCGKKAFSKKVNKGGFEFGAAVTIDKDRKDGYSKSPTKFQGKHGYVIGTTTHYVDVVVGNIFGDIQQLNVKRKRDHNVSLSLVP